MSVEIPWGELLSSAMAAEKSGDAVVAKSLIKQAVPALLEQVRREPGNQHSEHVKIYEHEDRPSSCYELT